MLIFFLGNFEYETLLIDSSFSQMNKKIYVFCVLCSKISLILYWTIILSLSLDFIFITFYCCNSELLLLLFHSNETTKFNCVVYRKKRTKQKKLPNTKFFVLERWFILPTKNGYVVNSMIRIKYKLIFAK